MVRLAMQCNLWVLQKIFQNDSHVFLGVIMVWAMFYFTSWEAMHIWSAGGEKLSCLRTKIWSWKIVVDFFGLKCWIVKWFSVRCCWMYETYFCFQDSTGKSHSNFTLTEASEIFCEHTWSRSIRVHLCREPISPIYSLSQGVPGHV